MSTCGLPIVCSACRSIHGKAAEPTQLLDAPWRSQKLARDLANVHLG